MMIGPSVAITAPRPRVSVSPVAQALARIQATEPVFGFIMPEDGAEGLGILGGKVATIQDLFGNGALTLSQSTASKRAAVDTSDLFGSRPALRLTPADFIEYVSASGGPTGTGSWTMIMIVKALAAAPGAFATGTVVGDTTPAEGSWLGVFGSTITTGRMLANDVSNASIFDTSKYHVFTAINRAGLRLLLADGGWIAQANASQTLGGSGKFGIGIPYIGGGSCLDGRLIAALWYNRDLGTDRLPVERDLCVMAQLGPADEAAQPRLTSDVQIVADGDSRTRGFGSSNPPATAWPALVGTALGVSVINSGADGAVIDTSNHLAEVDAKVGANRARNVLIGGYGYNDASSYTLAQRKSKFIDYIANRRKAGFTGQTGKIAWWTVPGDYTADNATLAGEIAAWNAWLKDTSGTGGAQYVDLVIDSASIPQLQDTTNGTYYSEAPGGVGVHFTDAANVLLAAFKVAAMQAAPGFLS